MAQIEINALSVLTCGSFTARVFLPGMGGLALDDRGHNKKYPVLWLLHDEGESSLQFLATPAERLAEEFGFFIICPDMQHAMGTNMKYGPRFEDFLTRELMRIAANNLPVSRDADCNSVGGIGTGGYAALKLALKHPDVYAKGFSINGTVDMGRIVRKALAGEDPGICHTKASLEAVFGELQEFAGGYNDLFAPAEKQTALQERKAPLFLACETDSPYFSENEAFAERLAGQAVFFPVEAGRDCFSAQQSLPEAVRWITGA